MAVNWLRRQRQGVVYYSIAAFDQMNHLVAAFSTRIGGISAGECATMNFSFKRNDNRDHVMENYSRLCDCLEIDTGSLCLTNQTHGDICMIADPERCSLLNAYDDRLPDADALITDRPGIMLVKQHADCNGIYLVDPSHHAVGLVHAGWRSTALNITGKTVCEMTKVYGTKPSDLIAALAPSIGVCCFEVGEDVAQQFDEDFIVRQSGGKPHIDLIKCNIAQLQAAGVSTANLLPADLCTACNTDTFYSHRRERGRTGTMVSILGYR